MSIQQLDQSVNRFGTSKVGDFLNSHTSPDGTQLIDDPDIPTGTINITENGTGIDVYSYATADVNVKTYDANLKALIQREQYRFPDDIGITTVGKYAFAYMPASSQAGIDIPAAVDTIQDYAFYFSGYGSIHIFGQLSYLGDYAFAGNTNLHTVYFMDANLGQVGTAIFDGCTSLTDIYYAGTEQEFVLKPQIPEGVTVHYEYTPENEET